MASFRMIQVVEIDGKAVYGGNSRSVCYPETTLTEN
jgi:hypothetical protein